MQWVLVIAVCLLCGGWLLNLITAGQGDKVARENPGRYWVGIVVLAIIAFFAFALLGTLVGN